MSYDNISRKEAINAVRQLLLNEDSAAYIYSDNVISAIENLPASQPVLSDGLVEMLCEEMDCPPERSPLQFNCLRDCKSCWKNAISELIIKSQAN